jgi:hypothetical protein
MYWKQFLPHKGKGNDSNKAIYIRDMGNQNTYCKIKVEKLKMNNHLT